MAQNPPPGKNPPPDKNPPPKPTSKMTQENFDKIDKGMSMDDVVALAGKPTTVITVDPANYPGRDAHLVYIDLVRNVGFTVDLFQGKVVEKGDSKPWPVVYPSDPPGGNPPPKPAGTLTRASFDKIDKGMSMDDVVALLGQPTFNVKLDPAKFQGVDTELTFTSINPNAAATVDLFQGKVVKKTRMANLT